MRQQALERVDAPVSAPLAQHHQFVMDLGRESAASAAAVDQKLVQVLPKRGLVAPHSSEAVRDSRKLLQQRDRRHLHRKACRPTRGSRQLLVKRLQPPSVPRVGNKSHRSRLRSTLSVFDSEIMDLRKGIASRTGAYPTRQLQRLWRPNSSVGHFLRVEVASSGRPARPQVPVPVNAESRGRVEVKAGGGRPVRESPPGARCTEGERA